MKNSIAIVLMLLLFQSCTDDSTKKEYMPLLTNLHKIECKHLKMEGKPIKYASANDFRSAAFQAVLKDMNRKVLVEYEGYYQTLAQQEFLMTDKEKQTYYSDIEKVYSEECK